MLPPFPAMSSPVYSWQWSREQCFPVPCTAGFYYSWWDREFFQKLFLLRVNCESLNLLTPWIEAEPLGLGKAAPAMEFSPPPCVLSSVPQCTCCSEHCGKYVHFHFTTAKFSKEALLPPRPHAEKLHLSQCHFFKMWAGTNPEQLLHF